MVTDTRDPDPITLRPFIVLSRLMTFTRVTGAPVPGTVVGLRLTPFCVKPEMVQFSTCRLFPLMNLIPSIPDPIALIEGILDPIPVIERLRIVTAWGTVCA